MRTDRETRTERNFQKRASSFRSARTKVSTPNRLPGDRFGFLRSGGPAADLPITVEMIVAVVVAAAASSVGNAEHAINGADSAANTCPDDLSDHAAYGSGHTVTFVSTLLRAAHDSLGASDLGKRQQGESERCARKTKLRRRTDRGGRRLGLIHDHLIS